MEADRLIRWDPAHRRHTRSLQPWGSYPWPTGPAPGTSRSFTEMCFIRAVHSSGVGFGRQAGNSFRVPIATMTVIRPSRWPTFRW
jgi:hypothetical protein